MRRRQDFAAVYRQGSVFTSGLLVLRVRRTPGASGLRFGFAVSGRMGGAVVRNRIKRRLREIARQSGAQGAADVVVSARLAARDASFEDLQGAFLSLLRRSGLLPTVATP